MQAGVLGDVVGLPACRLAIHNDAVGLPACRLAFSAMRSASLHAGWRSTTMRSASLHAGWRSRRCGRPPCMQAGDPQRCGRPPCMRAGDPQRCSRAPCMQAHGRPGRVRLAGARIGWVRLRAKLRAAQAKRKTVLGSVAAAGSPALTSRPFSVQPRGGSSAKGARLDGRSSSRGKGKPVQVRRGPATVAEVVTVLRLRSG